VCENLTSEGVEVEKQASVEREPPELKIAREKEPLYIKWVIENVNRLGGLTFYEAIYEGAKALDLSPVTTKRYLMKELTQLGLFRLGNGPRGHRRILLREGVT
jgi:hypothetical protein